MDKRHLHHIWTKFRPLTHWYFLGLFIISLGIGIYGLRSNNLTMIRLRDDVIRTDEQNGDTEAALRKLREYVHGHMNTNLASTPGAIRPPIQLRYRYERLVQAEKDRVTTINAKVYTEAQEECERRFPASIYGLYGGPRVPCNEQYITQNGVKEQPIPDAIYKFDFVSPIWSPDLAGWSLLASGLFLVLFVFRFGIERWVINQLR